MSWGLSRLPYLICNNDIETQSARNNQQLRKILFSHIFKLILCLYRRLRCGVLESETMITQRRNFCTKQSSMKKAFVFEHLEAWFKPLSKTSMWNAQIHKQSPSEASNFFVKKTISMFNNLSTFFPSGSSLANSYHEFTSPFLFFTSSQLFFGRPH